jgi:AAA family ATP:ADP antiporter
LRDALFLSAFSVASLPGIMVVAALVSVCGAMGFASALGRRPPAAILSGVLWIQALLLCGEWGIGADQPRLVAAAFYVQMAFLGPGIVSAFWSVVNERFDPHTARRVVGKIGTGASAGGVVGGALAWGSAHVLPVRALLPALAVVSMLAVFALRRLRPTGAPDPLVSEPPDGASTGLRSIRQYPYLLQLGGIVALGALAEALLDYLLKAGAARAFADAEQLGRFFGLFYACVALLTLAVQASATRPLLDRLGLAGTASVQPAAVAVVSAAGLLLPSLGSAVAARGLGSALRDSLFRSSYELFYTPLPAWQKRRSKVLVDIAADKIGSLTGATLLMLLVATAPISVRGLWLLSLVAMLGSVLLARRLHLGYVHALEGSLRSGAVDIAPDEVMDSTTRLTLTRTALDRESLLAQIRALHGETELDLTSSPDLLIADLESGQSERIRSALGKVRSADLAMLPMLVALLARDDVFPDALRALRRIAPDITGQLVDTLMDARQPSGVRRRIPRVLKVCSTPQAVDGLMRGLEDTDFAVRRACGAVLLWIRDRHADLFVVVAPVHAALARELSASGTEPEAQLDHLFALLSLVGEVEPLRVARWALRGQDQRLRGTALEYLDHVLPAPVRDAVLSRLRSAGPAPAVPRPRPEVEEELRQSSVSLPRGLLARKRP